MKTYKERDYIIEYFLTESSNCSGPDFNRNQCCVTLFPVCSVSKAEKSLIISDGPRSWKTIVVSPVAQITC